MNLPEFIDSIFVKIIHKKKALLKVAFWNAETLAIAPCQSHRFEIDIESKWVYSHIKLSSYFRYVLFQVITQFDMTANPPWFNTNHSVNAVECISELFERRIFWWWELFFLRNWISQHTVNQWYVQPLPKLAYLRPTFSLVNSMRFSEGSLSRKFIFLEGWKFAT